MQHRRVVLGGQLAGLAAIAAGLMLTVAGERTLGPVFIAAAFLLVAVSTVVLVRGRKGATAASIPPVIPPAPAVGRLAALGDAPVEDPRNYLGELILDSQSLAEDPRPSILAVAGPELTSRLEPFGPVVQLLPGAASVQIRRGSPRMLVIDRRGLDAGVWAHTETGAGSGLFRELADIIRQCQGQHIATVFLDCAEPDRFYTSTLRKLCRNVMPLTLEDLHPEGTAGSDLLIELNTWSLTEAARVR